MKPGVPARRWRQLSLLAVAVLAVHLLLLEGDGPILAPPRDRPVQHFTTRTVATPDAPDPPAAAPPPPPARPAPAAPPAPAPTRPAAPAPGPEPLPAPAPVPAPAAPAPPPVPAPPPAPAPAPLPAPLPAPPPAPPAATPLPRHLVPPPPAVLHYEVGVHARGFTLGGQARLDWRHDGQQYQLRLALSAPALRQRVQQSTGRITDEGLAPERFSDKARSEQATHFDRATGRVIFSNNRPEAALAPGMQDRLSVVMQLSMLVAGDPGRFAPGTQVVIPTASTREAEDWTFRVEGEEVLDLPGGRVRALKLLRLPRKEYDQKVELWLAPGQDYAPVRLRLTNPDGGWVDQRWSSTDRG